MPISYSQFAKIYRKLGLPPFVDTLSQTDPSFAKTYPALTTMQINVGYACNFTCAHCFLESSPQRTEMMSRQTMKECLAVFEHNDFSILDITGGAPEFNPNLEWLITQAASLGKVMVRSNAALLATSTYHHLIEVFRNNRVTVIVSLPCYTCDNVQEQRGQGSFVQVIAGIKALNAAGYGASAGSGSNSDVDGALELNLVYNPLGGYLPAAQDGLAADYRRVLKEEHGIVFDSLFCLANAPLGRFRDRLERRGELDNYLTLLYQNYNPATLPSMMCRSQLNVDYDGGLYDCEMNHVIGLPISGSYHNIADLKGKRLQQRSISLNDGCYVCTAGSGSSCGGALV
jgi:radical SAM/Cys-rich protein